MKKRIKRIVALLMALALAFVSAVSALCVKVMKYASDRLSR